MRSDLTVALAATAALALAAPAAHAQAFSCKQAAKTKCEKVMEKESAACQAGHGGCKHICCERAPCQYYQLLTGWLMLQALYADPAVVGCKGFVGSSVSTLSHSPAFHDALPGCPNSYEGHQMDNLPGFDTGKSTVNPKECNIKADGLVVTDAIAKVRYTTCSEMIEMAFAHEAVHMAVCAQMALKGADYEGQSNRAVAREERKGYQAAINTLKQDLASWPTACSVDKDTKKARKDAADGIKALKALPATGPGGKCS